MVEFEAPGDPLAVVVLAGRDESLIQGIIHLGSREVVRKYLKKIRRDLILVQCSKWKGHGRGSKIGSRELKFGKDNPQVDCL